jgi:hypothetical protein
VEEEHERIKELPRRISKIFRSYPQSDLEITWLRMIHAKNSQLEGYLEMLGA